MKTGSLVRMNADRALAVVLVVAGLLALVVGWFGISGKALAPEQLPYLISGGLGGVVLVAIGCTLALSADLQDEWRQLERVEERLNDLVAERGDELDGRGPTAENKRQARRVTQEAGA